MIHLDPVAIADIERIQKKIKQLGPVIGAAGVEQASNYLINVLVRKEIPPYRYISRKQAYGKTFQSAKQRRWFYAALHAGRIRIPYIRRSPRGGLAASWMISGKGLERTLENKLPSAFWVYSQRQARQLGLVGWKKVGAIIVQYEKNIVASFVRGANAAIKKLGLQ